MLALASATLLSTTISGCDQPPARDASNPDVGEITAELQLDPGVSLSSISYAITGPSSFTKNGTINLQASAALSAVIGPLPRGAGFGLTLTGTASDATTTCAGSATFSVVAGQTTPVAVHLLCHELPRLGSVRISGVFNTCPRVDGVSASPKQLAVGATSILGVRAHDADAGPSALAYHWSSNSGTLSNADVQSPSFTCTSVGTAHVTVTASDGDPLPSCPGSASIDIRCTGP